MSAIAPVAEVPALQARMFSLAGTIQELDGLRGIAILLVMIHHFWPEGGSQWSQRLAHAGWIGVDLFFVISGFLITGILLDTCREPHYFRNFYARRALRIFPLYYLFLILLFISVPLAQGGGYWRTEFIRESGSPLWYFAYMGNIREAITGNEPAYFLAVLWSLSIEEQFYIVFPFVVRLVTRRRLEQLLWVLIFFAPAFRTITLLIVPGNERIQYLATPSRVDVLAVGCLLAIMLRKRQGSINRTAISCFAGVSLLMLSIVFAMSGLNRMLPFCRTLGYSLVAITGGAVVLWTVVHRDLQSAAFLRNPFLRRFGKLCYGLYLLQRPSETLLTKVLHRMHVEFHADSFLLMGLKIAFAFLVASASWHLLEARMLQLKRYFVSKRHPTDFAGDVSVAHPFPS